VSSCRDAAGRRPRLLAPVIRSNATLAFAAERQVVGQTKVRIRRHHEHLCWAFVLSVVLSCSATHKTSSPRTPEPVAGHYPAEMKAQGIEGDVVLALTVLPDGSTSDIVVVKSGGAEFDRAATDDMRTARFRPATRDGVAVPSRIQWTYRFRLDSKR
jgi:TonB family protein